MKFNTFNLVVLVLSTLVYVTVSAPIITFPVVQFGIDVVKWTEEFLALFVTLLANNVSAKTVSQVLPVLSLEFNMAVIEPAVGDLNNYNTEFPVEGIKDGNVRWVVEAVNRTEQDPVLLYFHGGGYILGDFPPFPFFCARVYDQVENDRFSILMLDYTLAQDDPYPRQLSDAALVYNKLIESSNNVIVGGDSAGGHLSLNLLRHGAHPVQGVTEVDTDKITGAMLTSPWVSIHTDDDTGSHEYNEGKDILTPKIIREGGEMFTNNNFTQYTSTALNFYNDTETDWASIVPNKTFVNYGGHEVLLTDIESWIDIAGLSQDQVYMSPEGIHVSVIFSPDVSDITPKIVDFFKENF